MAFFQCNLSKPAPEGYKHFRVLMKQWWWYGSGFSGTIFKICISLQIDNCASTSSLIFTGWILFCLIANQQCQGIALNYQLLSKYMRQMQWQQLCFTSIIMIVFWANSTFIKSVTQVIAFITDCCFFCLHTSLCSLYTSYSFILILIINHFSLLHCSTVIISSAFVTTAHTKIIIRFYIACLFTSLHDM